MDLSAATRRRRARASPAATSSTAAPSTSNGRIYLNTLDGNTIAVDAETGKEVWRTKLGDIKKGETITMAPLVVEGKVLVGNSGGEMGVRGWLTALDAGTGKIVWKAYATGPDKDVLIGPDFKPFYAQDSGKDLGRQDLAAGRLEDRRRHHLGLDLPTIRDRRPDLLRHRQSGPVEPGAAPRRQQMDRRGLRPRHRDTGEAQWFYQSQPARPLRL